MLLATPLIYFAVQMMRDGEARGNQGAPGELAMRSETKLEAHPGKEAVKITRFSLHYTPLLPGEIGPWPELDGQRLDVLLGTSCAKL